MQLNITTDYAVRVILELANSKTGQRTGEEISESMQIPRQYLLKIIRVLIAGGLVEAKRGRTGGYRLKKDKITLYEVIALTEQSMKISVCLEDSCSCSKMVDEGCPIRNVYKDIQEDMDKRLKAYIF